MSYQTTLTTEVPADALRVIRAKIDRFARRCARRNLPAPRLVEGDRRLGPDPRRQQVAGTAVPQVEWISIELIAPDSIALGGWSLLGRVDRLADGSPFVVRTPGTEETPLPTIADAGCCEHCGAIRARRETFLVRHASGEVRQVGRDCLRDFLGHDPAPLLWWHSALFELADDARDWTNLPRGEMFWPTRDVLRLAARVAAHGGYLSRAKARQINEEIEAKGLARRPATASADRVTWRLDPPPMRRAGERERLIAEWDHDYPDDPAAERLLSATIEALAGLALAAETGSGLADEWQASLARLAIQPEVSAKHVNLLVSAVICGLRALEAEQRRDGQGDNGGPGGNPAADGSGAASRAASRHLGTVGERITLTAVVDFVRPFDGDWGPRTLIKLLAGWDRLAWWATGRPQHPDGRVWAVGDVVTVSGTVKAHASDRYDGQPVTELTRAKLELAAAVA